MEEFRVRYEIVLKSDSVVRAEDRLTAEKRVYFYIKGIYGDQLKEFRIPGEGADDDLQTQ